MKISFVCSVALSTSTFHIMNLLLTTFAVSLLHVHTTYAANIPMELLSDLGLSEETVLTDADFNRAKQMTEEELQNHGRSDDVIEKGDKFEGDIVKSVTENNAVRGEHYRWPNAEIPYAISSDFSSQERAVIASAIAEYHSETCIRFVQRSNQRDYLYIIKGGGCYSMVGVVGGRQELSLGNGCVSKGIAIHEFMHAAGFFHEQSRTDRDDYIQIQWQNIRDGMDSQFQKYSQRQIDHMGTDYDYGSIMHYGSTAFSKNNGATIIPINPRGAAIGNRRGFSSNDLVKLNKMYKCSGQTPRPATQAPTPEPVSNCQDNNGYCNLYAQYGYCWYASVQSMCKKSCKQCGGTGGSRCSDEAGEGFCNMVSTYRYCNSYGNYCKNTCNQC